VQRRPERVFKQERARKTHEALLRAAAKMFAEKGFEGTQTPDVAAAAGVSTGALYRYFKDKRALFLELMVAHLSDVSEAVGRRLAVIALESADRRAVIDEVIDILFDHMRRDAGLSRVYIAMSLTDPAVAELRAEFEAKERASLARIIEAAVPREVIPDPEAAALVVQVAAVEIIAERSGVRPSRGRRVSDKAVKAALREMFHRFLFPGEGPFTDGGARRKRASEGAAL
jgi:AcrR family transcriptional regulator